MEHYDTLLVLGLGIRPDGSLPDSAKALVEKTADLYKQQVARTIIFSGRWSYRLNYTPPTTEAEAMAHHAETLGIPTGAILIENESNTTISNLCLLKTDFCEPRHFHRILLVTLEPLAQRALFNAEMVFGSDYRLNTAFADYTYSPEKLAQLKEQETIKLAQAQQFHSHNKRGDHLGIHQAAITDLAENY